MLVVGIVSSTEEQKEIKFVAQIVLVGERVRYLAREQKIRDEHLQKQH